MDTREAVCEQITVQNYYKFAKKVEELKVKRAELQCEIALAKINKQINRVHAEQHKHNAAVGNIGTGCKLVVEHGDKLVQSINTNEPYLNVPFTSHKVFQDVIANRIFTSDFSHAIGNADVHAGLAHALETINNRSEQGALFKNNIDNSRQFFTKIMDLTGDGRAHLPRTRRSELSESTFMNTFQANNVSTSSPNANRQN